MRLCACLADRDIDERSPHNTHGYVWLFFKEHLADMCHKNAQSSTKNLGNVPPQQHLEKLEVCVQTRVTSAVGLTNC